MAQSARATLALPQTCPSFAVGKSIAGDRVAGLFKEGTQAVLFRLESGRILRVYYAGEAPARALRHKLAESRLPGICPILKMGRAGSHDYDVVPELFPLPSLVGLPDPERQSWIRKQIGALQTFHRMGYVHLDVKPEHFMQDRSGEVFLTDFGSARKKGAGGMLPKTTPGFAPPERMAGICEESYDWYSFGICLADELGGGVYPGMQREEIPAVLEGELPPTAQLLPIRYSGIIRELLKVDRNRRYNGEELLRALAGEPVRVAVEAEREPLPTMRHRERRIAQNVEPIVADTESLAHLQMRLRNLIVDRAKHANPTVYARQMASMRVGWNNRASVAQAVEALTLMPRENNVVNETNISKQEAEQVPGARILTDFSDAGFRHKSFHQRVTQLRGGQAFYVVGKAWLQEEERHAKSIAAKRRQQIWHVVKAVAILAALGFGIYLFILALPYLLLIGFIIFIIAVFT